MNNRNIKNGTVIRIAGDVAVSVPSSLQLMTPYVLREREDWFEDEIGFLRRHTRHGARVIDIGANYGLYSLSLTQAAGADGRVWAVEPCAATAAHLKASVDLNGYGNISIIQAALSDHVGTALLQVGSNSELNALVSGNESAMATEEVALTTLDRMATEHGCSEVDFVKIDAEGEEGRIIQGGRAFLQFENPLVMYELKHKDQINYGLIEAFGAIGYSSYRLVPGLDVLVPFDPAGVTDPYQLNLFCCKAARAEALAQESILAVESDIEMPLISRGDWWSGNLAQRPFARALRKKWITNVGGLNSDRLEYEAVLALYGVAHDVASSAAQRYAALKAAFKRLGALCAEPSDVYRLSTYARIAREFGEREVAVQVLGQALNLAVHQDPGPATEPFLPASAHFDGIDPDGKHHAWLVASLVDEFSSLATFSTYFPSPDLLQYLDALRPTGFLRPEMERRRQLMRIKAGLQPEATLDPRLLVRAPENRNPEFWMGLVA